MDRLWEKVDKSGPCWLWMGYCDPGGYGRLTQDGVSRLVHRAVYESIFGSTASEIDHACRVPRCVNPDHLRPVTSAQNKHNLGPRPGSRSGVRGVHWSKSDEKWHVQAKVNGIAFNGGKFDSIAEAERVAIELRNRLMTHNNSDRLVGY